MNAAIQTLKVGRTEYTVEKTEKGYLLHGVRGALYGLMRNAHRPEMLFPYNQRGIAVSAPLKGLWLTDADGTLRVA